MAKFQVEWTREQWFRVEIEADNESDALSKFWNGEFENEEMYGTEIQDGIDVQEAD